MNQLPENYIGIISKLKDRIRATRLKAAFAANKELLLLYWELGQAILEMQQSEGWGTRVIDRISADLKADFPDFKGLSVRNLTYMVTFARLFPLFAQQPAAQIEVIDGQSDIITQQLAAQLPWGHIQLLMDKTKEQKELDFYLKKCLENGWSRNILAEQIGSNLFSRQGKAITNFSNTLPALQSDLAEQTLKNPYLFDFLSLGEEARERDLENALIQHLKNFMLELGRGFAYVGRQKNLVVKGDDFFLDLLFYNYNLHCFVVIELKVGDFKPEYAGKLNFYINTVNEQIKGTEDKPTIGVLLCKTPNETVVRYSLQGIESPIGVAEYELAKALPKKLRGEIPSIEELEAEIEREYEELKSPAEKRLDLLKQKISGLNKTEVQIAITPEIFDSILKSSIIPLFQQLLVRLEEFEAMFMNKTCYWSGITRNVETPEGVDGIWNSEDFRNSNQQFQFFYSLWGFKKGGTDTFSTSFQLRFMIEPYWYGLVLVNHNNHQPFIKKLYPENYSKKDFDFINETISNYLIDQIEHNVEMLKDEKNG